MDHSYEEIRNASLDILSGREQCDFQPTQYEHLQIGVAEVLARTESPNQKFDRHERFVLSAAEKELFLEVFWDLFRQGIITLGLNDTNRQFPFCRISHFGKKLLQHQDAYFFHDVSGYTDLIRKNVPKIDAVTLLYLQEAMQAFRSGCILSATVMLGVATEPTFLLLLEKMERNPECKGRFTTVKKQKTILQKVNKFKNVLDQQSKSLPLGIREDIDTHFAGILSIIRTFRNESGHPTGKIIDREQAYVLLQLFVPYCKKMYQLMEYFRGFTANTTGSEPK